MNRRIIALIVAIALAAGGAALVIAYANNADSRAVADQAPVDVWVAQKLVPSGTTLKDAERNQLIVKTTVAQRGLPVGALQTIDAENSSLLALSDVQPGEFLLAARFGATPVGTKAIEVPAGKLAVSIQLTDPARVGKFVTPGSRISLFASYKLRSLDDTAAAKLINDNDFKGTSVLLPDVLVIGVGDSALAAPAKTTETSDATQNQQPSFLVTVAVSPDEATKLVHGINAYTLYAALRGADVKVNSGSRVDDLSVLGSAKVP